MARTAIRFTVRNGARALALASGIAVLGAAIGSWPALSGSDSSDAAPEVKVEPAQAPAGDEITCLLPAEVERLGSQLTHLGARRQVQLTPEECAARGGEIEAEGDAQTSDDEPES